MIEYKVLVNDNDDIKWYDLSGNLHRLNGPAVENANGHKEWYLNGKRHREDGPAIIYTNGDKEWFLHDKHHRSDGPAVENISGYKAWYFHGQRHRTNGPAIENVNGTKEYWIDNEKASFDHAIAIQALNQLESLLLSELEFLLRVSNQRNFKEASEIIEKLLAEKKK